MIRIKSAPKPPDSLTKEEIKRAVRYVKNKGEKEGLLYWLSQAKWYHPLSDQKERKSNEAYKQIVALIKKSGNE